MTDSETDPNPSEFHIEGGIPVFNTRLNQIQREQQDAKERDKKYSEEQLRLNRRMTWFTGLLVGIGFLGFLINSYQSHIASVNARAAQENAAAAKGMVEEMRKSGSDTHELSVQSGKQAEWTKDLADRALLQATATNELAKQARRSGDISKQAIESNIELSRDDRRPWVSVSTFRCGACSSDANWTLTVKQLTTSISNTGKTPAIGMEMNAALMERTLDDPVPTLPEQPKVPKLQSPSDSQFGRAFEIISAPILEVLAPNANRDWVLVGDGRMQIGRSITAPLKDRKIVYIVGRITYYDTRHDKRHSTNMCLMSDISPNLSPGGGAGFRLCPTGNDMD